MKARTMWAWVARRVHDLVPYCIPKNQSQRKVPMKSRSLISHIATLAITFTILPSSRALAQSVPAGEETKTVSTWRDLGFDDAPEGFSTHQIPLFEGLNKSRGGWLFKGSVSESDTATSLEGRMEILGSFKDGMIPMWNLALGWPVEEPKQMVRYSIFASPEGAAFKLMLARIGPAEIEAEIKPPRAMFQGKWNLESLTIAWTKVAKSALLPGLPAESKEGPDTPESFEMVLTKNGGITVQHPAKAAGQARIVGKTNTRMGKPYAKEPVSKKANFATFAEVSDARLKQCLPPGAKEITLHRERGGHFARYKVSEEDFHKFLDRLWKAEKANSAHQRAHMHGEGEPANDEKLAKRFEPLGWKALKGAVVYYSPSKASGAMTTYYFDQKAGIVYHDTGYW
jgi:hypothetical protein